MHLVLIPKRVGLGEACGVGRWLTVSFVVFLPGFALGVEMMSAEKHIATMLC